MSRELLIDVYIFLMSWGVTVGIMSIVLHSRVDWRATEVGRHLMFYMGVLPTVLALSLFRILFAWSSDWFLLLNLGVFALVPLAMTQRLWLQWKAQHPKPPPTPPNGTPMADSSRR